MAGDMSGAPVIIVLAAGKGSRFLGAEHKLAQTLGGLAMLVHQGAASFRLWTGQDPPLTVMFEAARAALEASAGRA